MFVILYVLIFSVFIGPESDHCFPLIDVTLACEDANSKLVDFVTVADEDRVANNL